MCWWLAGTAAMPGRNIGEMSFVCVNRYLLRAEWSYLSTTGCLTLIRLFRLLAYLNYACMLDPLPYLAQSPVIVRSRTRFVARAPFRKPTAQPTARRSVKAAPPSTQMSAPHLLRRQGLPQEWASVGKPTDRGAERRPTPVAGSQPTN